MKKRKISLMLVLMLVLITVSNTILAAPASLVDTSKKGSITINALAQNNGGTDTTALDGVVYSIYKVDDFTGETVVTKEEAEAAIAGKTATAVATTTNGVASFTDLELARYYVVATTVPTGVSVRPDSFLVDVPMTNVAGDGWIYDIEASPKIQTITGTAELTKKDEANNPIQGAVFNVEMSTKQENGTWTDWTPYIPEGETTAVTLTTDENGVVKLEDFPITWRESLVRFRFVEVSLPTGYEKYIIDNKTLDYVYVNGDAKVVVVHTDVDGNDTTSEVPADTGILTVINEKPTLTKEVKNDDGTYDKAASIGNTSTTPEQASYKITLGVPSVISHMTIFTLTDTLPAGLKERNNIVITGMYGDDNSTETIATTGYTKTEGEKELKVEFDTATIAKYHTIIVTYDAKLDVENAIIGEVGNINTAKLEYTRNTTVADVTEELTDTAKIVTGGIKIHKVDEANNALSGAIFKIAETKADAEAGNFVKDENGVDLSTTTGADGYGTIDGLEYGDDETEREYWLVEIQAPTYEDNGETKSYTLLSSPKSIKVSGTSHTVENYNVVNKKPYDLPLTGGIGTVLFIIAGVSLIVIAKSIKKEEVK